MKKQQAKEWRSYFFVCVLCFDHLLLFFPSKPQNDIFDQKIALLFEKKVSNNDMFCHFLSFFSHHLTLFSSFDLFFDQKFSPILDHEGRLSVELVSRITYPSCN